MAIYEYSAETIDGKEVSLDQYKGKVLVIVNTASKCGYTPQYEGLQKLYERHREQGLEVIGFPCNQFGGQEPGSNEDVQTFCRQNYGITFPLFAKIDVNGENAHPLYRYLTEEAPFQGFDLTVPRGQRMQERFPEAMKDNSIKWNFTKFLVDRNGRVVTRFESTVEPADMEQSVEALLA